ncbi:helix-turn-helix domain-containing protein [Glutamicibacter sp. MNS18]|uniref:helix-turn-helix domain-containing protein n=1 Tax=Glutamicibacter sp. MNS18 TaxID=2989817 RepID=UPI00278BD54A|nr:helix-turn-helix domain-containing protein [Glutamicibacter sp. MNS18]
MNTGARRSELSLGIQTRMYTVTQVASLLEISGMTVYRLIKTGELSAVQFGKSVKISKEAEPVRKFV